MSNPLILIVGLPGSGKTFAGQILKKRFKAKVVETGDVIRDEIKRRGWKYTPKTSEKIRHYFHSGREHLVVKRTWNKVKKYKNKIRVIVGFRALREIGLLKKHYKGEIVIIAVVSSFKIRARREQRRKRFGKSESLAFLKHRDKDEKKIGEANLIKHANYRINNSNLSKKQMEIKLVKLVRKITKQI